MKGLFSDKPRLMELVLGLLTWGGVSAFTFRLWTLGDANLSPRVDFEAITAILVAILLVTNLGGFCWRLLARHSQSLGLIAQGVSLLMLMWLFPSALVMILGIMLAAHLGEYLRPVTSVAIALLLPVLYVLLSPLDYAWINAALLCLFNLFALFVAGRAHTERKAKEANAHLLRELRATQGLLYSTAQRDERLRIARDLHDLLGHHLAALSIQLEVASQVSEPAARPHIGKAQNIAKLLLCDVREAVSDIRQRNELDMRQALEALIQDLKTIRVDLTLEPGLTITNARVAEALFRAAQEAITNSIRHGQAKRCELDLTRQGDSVVLAVRDNGRGATTLALGNGLKGMKERIEQLDGKLQLATSRAGFNLVVNIPDPVA